MKSVIIYVLLAIISSPQVFAQAKIISFTESKATGPSILDLDARYKSALHSDTSLAVFKTQGEQTKFIAAYQTFIGEIGAYLRESGFEWPTPTRIFNRFYVSKDGEITYYIYNVLESSPQLDGDSIRKFERLMTSFFKNHKFEIAAQSSFAQCSPVVFQ